MNELGLEQLAAVISDAKNICRDASCKNCKFEITDDELGYRCSDVSIADYILKNYMVFSKMTFDISTLPQATKNAMEATTKDSKTKTITDIMYVEDGSVDVEALQESLGDSIKIVAYRQGAVAPTIKHLDNPITVTVNEHEDSEKKENKKVIPASLLDNEIIIKLLSNSDMTFSSIFNPMENEETIQLSLKSKVNLSQKEYCKLLAICEENKKR